MRPSSLFGATILGLLSLLGSSPTPSQAKPPDAAPHCGQRGRVVFDKDTIVTDASGRRLARFSGGESAVTFIAPPSGNGDLARIQTGTGRGSFRVDGFVKAAELPIYAGVNLPIVSGRLWLGAGTRVTAAGVSGGKVRIDKQLTRPFKQRFTTTAECSSLTFTPPAPTPAAMPGNARVYLMKVPGLDLYDDVPPTGEPFATLQRSQLDDNVPFYSTEARGGFVHIQYRGELNVDAWARASELQALPRGETSDTAPTSFMLLSSPPQLALSQLPRSVKTTRELPLRISAREADPPIGIIEADTELYLMDTVAGWVKVLPKSLHVLPVDELAFWVKASELGL